MPRRKGRNRDKGTGKIDPTEKKRTLRTFAAATLLNDMGSDMIFPIWPLFMTVFLKANLMVLGFVDGLGTAIVALSSAFSGYLSDRSRKRKPFIWSGYMMSGVSRIGYALTTVWFWLIPFKVLDRGGKIRGAPRDAMVADVSTDKDRGSNFGVLRAMDNLGAVIGVIATLILFGTLKLGYRTTFLIAAIPSLIGAVLIFIVIKEKRPVKDPKRPTISFKDLGRLDDRFWSFTSVSVIFALANFNFSFLIIYAVDTGIHTDVTILLYLLFNLVAALMAYPFGRAADNIGRVPILLLSFAMFGLMCWAFTLAHAILTVIMLFVLYGLFKAALEPVEKAYVCEIVPPDLKASGLGVYLMVTGITALPASFLTGYLWEVYGLATPFTFSALLAAIACLGLVFVIGKYRGRGSRTRNGPCD